MTMIAVIIIYWHMYKYDKDYGISHRPYVIDMMIAITIIMISSPFRVIDHFKISLLLQLLLKVIVCVYFLYGFCFIVV